MSAAGMATLSVTVITLNEERHIRDCLASVSFADEIIVVDSGSTDRTVDICRELGARVIERDWPGYCAQKQFAHEQATGDLVLNLDADERLTDEAAHEIRQLLAAQPSEIAGWKLPRLSRYLGRWIRHGGWYPDRQLRLVRRIAGRWTGGAVHERIAVDGPVGLLQGGLLHYVYDNISDQLRTVEAFSAAAASDLPQRSTASLLLRMLVRPPIRFLEMYVWKQGWRDRLPGFIIASVSAYYVFLKYARRWELNLGAPDTPPGLPDR